MSPCRRCQEEKNTHDVTKFFFCTVKWGEGGAAPCMHFFATIPSQGDHLSRWVQSVSSSYIHASSAYASSGFTYNGCSIRNCIEYHLDIQTNYQYKQQAVIPHLNHILRVYMYLCTYVQDRLLLRSSYVYVCTFCTFLYFFVIFCIFLHFLSWVILEKLTPNHGTSKHGTSKHGTSKHDTSKHGTSKIRSPIVLWCCCNGIHIRRLYVLHLRQILQQISRRQSSGERICYGTTI